MSATAINVAAPKKTKGEELIQLALKVPVADRGTPYEITDKELKDLRAKVYPKKHSGHFVTEVQAVAEIRDHNRLGREPTLNEAAAINRLHAALSLQDWHPDVVIKTFNDLDTIFFDGLLRGHVTIQWSDSRLNDTYVIGSSRDPRNLGDVEMQRAALKYESRLPLVADDTARTVTILVLGNTRRRRSLPGQCRIWLNADHFMIQSNVRSHIWFVLLHEMCVSIALTPLKTYVLARLI